MHIIIHKHQYGPPMQPACLHVAEVEFILQLLSFKHRMISRQDRKYLRNMQQTLQASVI